MKPQDAANDSAPAPAGARVDPARPAEDSGPDTRERELVARARDGDVGAWSRIYQERHDWLLRECTFLVGDVSLAEDLVQEAFASALGSLASFRGDASFSTWLRAIALNLSRKHWRSQDRRRRAMEGLRRSNEAGRPPLGRDPEADEVKRRRATALALVLETLPGHLREAFVLCDVQQYPPAEAAEALGISSGNLRVRASRARTRIRRELERLGWRTQDGGEA